MGGIVAGSVYSHCQEETRTAGLPRTPGCIPLPTASTRIGITHRLHGSQTTRACVALTQVIAGLEECVGSHCMQVSAGVCCALA